LRHLRGSDIRGIAQLATQATVGVTRIAEGVHQSVWSTLGAPGGRKAGQTRGFTGLVYRSVEGITQLLGKGADTLMARLQPLLELTEKAPPESPQREAVLAALNGVMGDRLAAIGSPFATRMTLRFKGTEVRPGALAPGLFTGKKAILLVHGLCMNDLQWQTKQEKTAFDHGASLGSALQAPALYLRYNTGRHISENGAELSDLLELLLGQPGNTFEQVTVVAHSMGGLVIRSALHQATERGQRWPSVIKNIVFLGTPHHGAPLERAGNWVDEVLGSTPWSAPFARLGQLRSAGITDLRYGFVADADWQGHERFRRQPDQRLHVPLPKGIACYAVAATVAAKRSPLADRLVGDGLVPLQSALGQHQDPLRTLVFAKSCQFIAWRTHHIALLDSPEVAAQMLQWLAPSHDGARAGP
jgi:pimeloyl-ACP methyl ester carboxylesterase